MRTQITRHIRAARSLRAGLARLALVLVALVGALLFSTAAAAAEPAVSWWLQVKTAACAQGDKVLVGDIAEARGGMSAEAWKELSARPLWPAPEKPGHQTALSRERLAAMLQHHLPDYAGVCALPNQLVVQRGGKVLDGDGLVKHTVAFLTERAQELRGEIEITDIHVPEYIFLPNQRDTLDILVNGPVKPGRNNLLLEVRDASGKSQRRFAVTGFVNVWKPVACASRPLNRLELVTPEHVTFIRKNLAYYPKAWDGTGGPWRATRSVGGQQVINQDGLEPVPVIAKGAKIDLVFEGQNLRLSAKVEALDDAGVGQKIKVRNLQSKKIILATVQDAATVVVR